MKNNDRIPSREKCYALMAQYLMLPHIAEHERVLTQAARLMQAARALDLPITVTEQYPRGLGPTVPPIVAAAGDAPRLEKTTFSVCADEGCRAAVASAQRPQVLLVGIETHVCVQQTAVDLLEMQMRPFVLADAVGSRRTLDHEVALHHLRGLGVAVTTVESVIFALVRESGTELFKRILPIVR